MDEKTYVTRLKKMLKRYPDTVYSHCPVGKYYIPSDNANGPDCQMCQSFVGLKTKIRRPGNLCCPCNRPNAETAIKRALKYIALYEEKHGEVV